MRKGKMLLANFAPADVQLFSHDIPVVGDIHILQRYGKVQVWVIPHESKRRVAVRVTIQVGLL